MLLRRVQATLSGGLINLTKKLICAYSSFVLRLPLSSIDVHINALQAYCRTETARIRHTNNAYQKGACAQCLIGIKAYSLSVQNRGKQIHMFSHQNPFTKDREKENRTFTKPSFSKWRPRCPMLPWRAINHLYNLVSQHILDMLDIKINFRILVLAFCPIFSLHAGGLRLVSCPLRYSCVLRAET